MKRNRLLLFLGAALAVLPAGWLVLWLTAPTHRITLESFMRIQKGMTEAEVRQIMGRPGDSSIQIKAPPRFVHWKSTPWGDEGISRKIWGDGPEYLMVNFNASGTVSGATVFLPRKETLLEKLRRHFSL